MDTDTTRLGLSLGRRARWVALAAVIAMGFAACGDDDDDDAAPEETETTEATETTEDTGGGDTGGDAGATVPYEVTEISYQDVSAPAGGIIEIINTSGAPHTFTADEGGFDVDYGGDESATVDVPAEAGEYTFHCEIHPSMTATLTVD
ncbi:MAG: cupredoxin domain-containing protein [Acidimicrobiales bacterium]